PGLARIRWLSLETPPPPRDGLLDLLRSPHLAGLHGLSIRGMCLPDAFLPLVTSLPRLAGLRELFIGGGPDGDVQPDHVAALSRLASLCPLDLWGWQLGEGVRVFWSAAWPCLASLRLRSNRLEGRHLEGIGDGACMPALSSLDLSANSVTQEGAQAIARAVRW